MRSMIFFQDNPRAGLFGLDLEPRPRRREKRCALGGLRRGRFRRCPHRRIFRRHVQALAQVAGVVVGLNADADAAVLFEGLVVVFVAVLVRELREVEMLILYLQCLLHRDVGPF